jgi:hypothetical protein
MPNNTQEADKAQIDYKELGKAIVEALNEATTTKEAAVQMDSKQLCKLETMIVQLAVELKELRKDLAQASEATNNKLALALQASIQVPNATTEGKNEFKTVME